MSGSPSGSTPPTACPRSSSASCPPRPGWRSATTSCAPGSGPGRCAPRWPTSPQSTETGGFRFLKTAGPAHLSFADRGVTFATNGDRAACVRFHEPVRAIDPTGLIRHPGATLTVADPPALIAALEAR